MNKTRIKEIFIKTIGLIIGFDDNAPLGNIKIKNSENKKQNTLASIFQYIITGKEDTKNIEMDLFNRLKNYYSEAEEIFISFYLEDENSKRLNELWEQLELTGDIENCARIISEIWVPELSLSESEIIEKWRLKSIEPNPSPLKPQEIVIQLNALYSLPDKGRNAPESMIKEWEDIKSSGYKKIADYDHPVPIFEANEHHELIKCLEELEGDVAFEKSKGVLPEDYSLLVLISISVTHDALDNLAAKWVQWLLKEKSYPNLEYILLSETNVNRLKNELLKEDFAVFSVFGKYAKHFNALKYMQLLLEKPLGIRAGFKLDTDEGIRSMDLLNAKGQTWFQVLCHEYWGGSAVDSHGSRVELGINEGEYIRGADIDKHSYDQCLRMPEVPMPASYVSSNIFFNKPLAQAIGTGLYNKFCSCLEDRISHPIVKGGGYGITNDSLKRYAPFTLSEVGRAEDQQFYFHGMTKGLRGIFHPDLRIAHYKSTVARSEEKTEATRLMGDMYRLIIFQHLVEIMNIKDDIDPFPGIFAGRLASAQAFFNIIYKAYQFFSEGKTANAEYILTQGFDLLDQLKEQIKSGEIKKLLKEEQKQWENFISRVNELEAEDIKKLLDELII